MGGTLYLTDRASPAFEAGRTMVDVVCAGDSITGWNNFGGVECWPYRTYPEFLGTLCERSGMIVADCGIAGEVSTNGFSQIVDYLGLFPNAPYFVLGYGSNDLDKWPEGEAISPRIIENLDRMVTAIRRAGRTAILLDVLDADESALPREEVEPLNRRAALHNSHLRHYCRASRVPLVEVFGKLGSDHYADPFHPNDEGARLIAVQVFRVLAEVGLEWRPGLAPGSSRGPGPSGMMPGGPS
jgi:lysophospholipase L1-like esterase